MAAQGTGGGLEVGGYADRVLVSASSIGTAVPSFRVDQAQVGDLLMRHVAASPRTRSLYGRIFSHGSVRTRHAALATLEQLLDDDRDRMSRRFESEAVALSTASLARALELEGAKPTDVDFVVTTTCTGFMCPGLSAHLVQHAGLRPDVRCLDIAGMGCGAAVPALQQAHDFLQTNPNALALVVCTEVCSAAISLDDSVDSAVSNALFADGSATVVLRTDRTAVARHQPPGPHFLAFESLLVPRWRDTLRFVVEGGRIRNVLAKTVPAQVAKGVSELLPKLLAATGMTRDDIDHWIVHPGGARVLESLERCLVLSPGGLDASRRILRDYGNMSSPTVLFVLDDHARRTLPRRGDRGILLAFGAGFAVYGAVLEW